MLHLDPASQRQRSGSRRRPRSLFRSQRPTLERLEDRQLMTSSLIGQSFPLSPPPMEGTSFTGIIAKFTDADKNTDPAQYAASIQWGDGTTSPGMITADPSGGFDVNGTHTFTQGGPSRITAQIGDTDGDVASVSTTNIVSNTPVTVIGVPVRANKAGVVPKSVVAVFVDGDTSLKASAFTATINWGDGQTSAGTIVADKTNTFFKVLGTHKYKKAGTFSVTTTVQQGSATAGTSFTESDVISDGAVPADHIDPNFVNPWGLAAPNPADLWDSNNGTGTSTVFSNTGNIVQALHAVVIPPPAGGTSPSAPTGVVNNLTSAFVVTDGTKSGPAIFIWATEDGTIAGWNPTVATNGSPPPSTHAVLAVDNSASSAVYKGLAILNVPAGTSLAAGQYLFATNFRSGNLDVFDSTFKPVTLSAGMFQDPTIPAGFAPFGIQTIGSKLYVTYAKQNAAKHDDVAGAGNGFVDVFSSSGVLLQRLGGTGVQSELNSPWGVAQAPTNFGAFSNDILVGNFRDSHISAFDPVTGAFLGQLNNDQGKPLTLDGGVSGPDTIGLWGIFAFSGNTTAVTGSTLYFASGFNDETDGLFGALTATSISSGTATTTTHVTVNQPKGHK
jgi:uncharacterized protein (TIGR03118 family)